MIYSNIVKHSGWDGIQVSSAALHSLVYNNIILNDSEAEEPGQMSGILLGGGSSCDCFDNLIANGKGDGIEDHGLGGNNIYQNTIINAGRTYLPHIPAKMKHGIFVSDVSAKNEASLCIVSNQIINPKSDGIRFQRIRSRQNLVANNHIVHPGNLLFYNNGILSHKSSDAYILIPDKRSDINLINNFFTDKIPGFFNSNYLMLIIFRGLNLSQ
jgi:hypothetical protein